MVDKLSQAVKRKTWEKKALDEDAEAARLKEQRLK